MKKTIFISIDPASGWFQLESSYLDFARFGVYFKGLVTPPNRKWNPSTKTWLFARRFWSSVQPLIEDFFDVADYSSEVEAALVEIFEGENEGPDFAAFQMLGVRTEAPDCVVEGAYAAIERAHKIAPGGIDPLLPDIASVREAYRRICNWRAMPHHTPREIQHQQQRSWRSDSVNTFFARRAGNQRGDGS